MLDRVWRSVRLVRHVTRETKDPPARPTPTAPRRAVSVAALGLVALVSSFVRPDSAIAIAVGEGAGNHRAYIDAYNAVGGSAAIGSPVNTVHNWGPGCIQDFSGGRDGKSGIMSRGCSGAAYVMSGEFWRYFEGRFGDQAAHKLGYPYNFSHRWGPGWVQDLDGGSMGWNILMMGDRVGRVHTVFGGIRDKYIALGGAPEFLGFPTSDEYSWNGEVRQNFEGGSIIWNASAGARLLNGVGEGASNQRAYIDAYNAVGGAASIGAPVNRVHNWGPGCIQDFSGGQDVKSAIMSRGCGGPAFVLSGSFWGYFEGRFGGEAAHKMGYPYNFVHRWGPGWVQDLDGGSMGWNIIMLGDRVGQVHMVFGGIRAKYIELGGAPGFLGFPTSDEYSWNGDVRQDFEGGSIIWNASAGARLLNGVGEGASNQRAYVDAYNAVGGSAAIGSPVNTVHNWGPGCTRTSAAAATASQGSCREVVAVLHT